jgi:hypothetical protein
MCSGTSPQNSEEAGKEKRMTVTNIEMHYISAGRGHRHRD